MQVVKFSWGTTCSLERGVTCNCVACMVSVGRVVNVWAREVLAREYLEKIYGVNCRTLLTTGDVKVVNAGVSVARVDNCEMEAVEMGFKHAIGSEGLRAGLSGINDWTGLGGGG